VYGTFAGGDCAAEVRREMVKRRAALERYSAGASNGLGRRAICPATVDPAELARFAATISQGPAGLAGVNRRWRVGRKFLVVFWPFMGADYWC